MVQEQNESYGKLLNVKSQIANIIYDIDELDLEVTGLSELVEIADS